jgi:hypothetical protein
VEEHNLLVARQFLLLAQHYKVVVAEMKVMAAAVVVAVVDIGAVAAVQTQTPALLEVVVLVISTQLL